MARYKKKNPTIYVSDSKISWKPIQKPELTVGNVYKFNIKEEKEIVRCGKAELIGEYKYFARFRFLKGGYCECYQWVDVIHMLKDGRIR